MAEIREKALQKRWSSKKKETSASTTAETSPSRSFSTTATIKGRFITKEIDLPGEILVFYWLAKAAFTEYDATEGSLMAK